MLKLSYRWDISDWYFWFVSLLRQVLGIWSTDISQLLMLAKKEKFFSVNHNTSGSFPIFRFCESWTLGNIFQNIEIWVISQIFANKSNFGIKWPIRSWYAVKQIKQTKIEKSHSFLWRWYWDKTLRLKCWSKLVNSDAYFEMSCSMIYWFLVYVDRMT